jgi:hypothetical protein
MKPRKRRQDPLLQKAIKEFDIIEFLDEHDITYLDQGKNIGKNYWGVAPCPNCGDEKFHFGIHRESKSGNCWICGYKTWLPGLIAYYAEMRIGDAIDLVLDTLDDQEMSVVDRVREIINYEPEKKESKPSEKVKLPISKAITTDLYRAWPPIMHFLHGRKINVGQCTTYGLRLGIRGRTKGKLIFPVRIRKRLVAYQSRALNSKMYNTQGDISKYLLFEDHINPDIPILLVEGWFDFIKVDTFIRAMRYNAQVTSGLTKQLSEAQKQKLNKLGKSGIVTLFDYDAWHDYLKLRDDIFVDVDFAILPRGKDPDEMSWNELENLFSELTISHLK